jgi:Bacterial Ig-like domain (group 2)
MPLVRYLLHIRPFEFINHPRGIKGVLNARSRTKYLGRNSPAPPFFAELPAYPTAGSTIQLFATALDSNGLIVSTTFTWSSDNAGVVTVNSSTGVVTGVASGICNIQAQADDSGAAKSGIAVGVALLSANTISLAYGEQYDDL